MKRLENKVAIVTGASKGIGAGIAKASGAEGAAVVGVRGVIPGKAAYWADHL